MNERVNPFATLAEPPMFTTEKKLRKRFQTKPWNASPKKITFHHVRPRKHRRNRATNAGSTRPEEIGNSISRQQQKPSSASTRWQTKEKFHCESYSNRHSMPWRGQGPSANAANLTGRYSTRISKFQVVRRELRTRVRADARGLACCDPREDISVHGQTGPVGR